MNHAWISGRAGCAVVFTPEDTYLLEAGTPKPPSLCSPGQLNNLRNLAADLVRSAAGPFPFQDIQQKLDMAWRSQSVLAMLLTALDAEHSSSLRSEAAGVAERLLAAPEVREGVRWRLLSTPLPRQADLEGIQLWGWSRMLVNEALRMRLRVTTADAIWEDLSFGSPLGPEKLARLRRLFILYGGFAERIASLRGGPPAKLEAWVERIPSGERDILDLAALDFLSRWSLKLDGYFCALPKPKPKKRKNHNVA